MTKQKTEFTKWVTITGLALLAFCALVMFIYVLGQDCHDAKLRRHMERAELASELCRRDGGVWRSHTDGIPHGYKIDGQCLSTDQ